jgi:putative ABC transport system permease protein
VGAAILVCIALQRVIQQPLWGLLATASLAVAIGLMARPLVYLTSLVPVTGVGWLIGPVARFAVGAFSRSARRAALTVAMLGVSVGGVIWLRVVAHSFEQSLGSALSEALRGDVVVTSSHIASGYVEAPVNDGLVNDLRAVDGVAHAVGERLTDWHYDNGPIGIDAFDGQYFTSGAFGRWRLIGAGSPDVMQAVGSGAAVLVSSNMALNVGVGVGSILTLDTPTGPVELPVAGVTINFVSPRGTVILARQLYSRMWRDHQVNRVFVRTVDGADVEDIRRQIRRRFGQMYGLRLLSGSELIDYFRSQVRRAFAPVDVLAVLIFVVILIGVTDNLGASVVERTREIGVIRAAGVRRRHLRRIVNYETLIVAVLGLCLAVSGGLALGLLWVKGTFPLLLGWAVDMYIPWGNALVLIAITTAVCLTAALLPAHHAAGMEPATTLRHE